MTDSRLASIHPLYMAIARGEIGGFTTPAFNLRGMTEELSQGIFEAATESNTGVFVLEIARSEMGYTGQGPAEFVERVLVGAQRAGWERPIFVQGDHSQAKAESPGKIASGEIETIKKLIDSEIACGFYNIDIDASTLVDITKNTIDEQQRENARVTSELARYIRSRQPSGMEISIGGEIGHIGDRNSTIADLSSFARLFAQQYPTRLAGLSKISVQTGTAHGGRMGEDGKLEEMAVDFGLIERLSAQAKEIGMAGVVQHGASTLPASLFPQFPARGAIEIHLSTGWQNMILDHPDFPPTLLQAMYNWVEKERGSSRVAGESEQQFLYRVRKYAWGVFRTQLDSLSADFKLAIKNEMKARCLALFGDLKVVGTRAIVDKYIPRQTRLGKMRMRGVEEADVAGKRIVVRVDWNVTLGKTLQIVDDTRIVRTLPTIKWLQDRRARQIILLSHLGKPKVVDPALSLRPVAEYARELLGEEIVLHQTVPQCHSDTVARVMMLENVRFWGGEDINDETFAQELASLGDLYVNEAFGECHRASASIVGITKYMPSYAGMWLREEVTTICKLRNNPERPVVVVMGGAKVEDKLGLLELLSHRADVILLGGKLANEYLQKDLKLSGRARILTPLEGDQLLDIGGDTQALYAQEIATAKTVIWNGPMGKVEDPLYRAGTEAIYRAITANTTAYTLVGGGDTLAAIRDEGHLARIDHVSTGGGAMLKLLEDGTLVGVEALII